MALDQARKAHTMAEVPIGAVIVRQGEIIGVGFNQTISHSDPTAHAEIVAIRAAAKYVGNHRLAGPGKNSLVDFCRCLASCRRSDVVCSSVRKSGSEPSSRDRIWPVPG